MKTNLSAVKIGLASAFLTALAGCTTYVVQPTPPPTATVYTPPPEPVVVQPAPPAPAPVVVAPAPAVVVSPPAVVVIQREDDFYTPLSPYGQWVDVPGFGRCWRPGGVDVAWRPYTSGHWELTDQGWYWDSDEPWGWATYHYGRWQLTPSYGWVWAPAVQWAPAWVTWREGGGYIGWAPLPPEPRPGITIDVTIRPAAFCFVEERHMHEPVRPTTVIVNNTKIINKTVITTKTKIVNKVVINEGPRVDVVERASGRRIEKVTVNDLRHRDEQPVADRHPNLRTRETAPERLPVEKKPEQQQPRPENVRVEQRENPQPRQVQQLLPRETEKPLRKEPARPELVTAPARDDVHPQPLPTVPQRERQPAQNRNNQERVLREQNPPPAAREARPVERPQAQPDLRARERQPRSEETTVQSPPQPERERPAARPQTQRNEPGAGNGRNTEKAKARGRENAGTNNADNANERGRR